MQKPIALPLTITLLLHAAVGIMLALNFSFKPDPVVLPPEPKIIDATLVSLTAVPAARAVQKPVEAPPEPVAKPAAPPKPTPVEAPKPELSKPEPIKPQQPVVPVPKPDVEKQKQAEQQKQIENEKRVQLEKDKLEKDKLEKDKVEKDKQAQLQKQKAEQQKQEQQKLDAERQRKEQEQADALRKKQQEDQARKQREQQEKNELAKAMAAEDNAVQAERDQEAIASFQGKIAHDIENSWSRPPNARLGMQVTLSIQLLHSGELVNVSVAKSSGNDAFDQSAVSAVRRVAKFPYLSGLSQNQFDKNFRPLMLNFNPTDLRQ
ncbi:MAG: protein TolA [Verrucomicrobiaceae bacterium]|nr:protein TolA [Verrucomicrobiaceae bacterium]